MNERTKAVYALLKSFPMEAMKGDSVEEQTPLRVAKMWDELLTGYNEDPEAILSKRFKVESSDMVVVKDIQFYSHCEHHLVPFFGKISIAYIPSDEVVGLSKFARLVDCFAHRLQVQERLTAQIADAIETYLKPKGVMVIAEAEHMCMTMRGVQKPGTKTVTSVVRGVLKDSLSARQEAEWLMSGSRM